MLLKINIKPYLHLFCFIFYSHFDVNCLDNDNKNDLVYSLNKALIQKEPPPLDLSNLIKKLYFFELPCLHLFYLIVLDCCDETFIINSETQPEGYLKSPPIYAEINEPKNIKSTIECLYKFYGKPNERIQLFYEDFDLYYPYDINKFNKIELVFI